MSNKRSPAPFIGTLYAAALVALSMATARQLGAQGLLDSVPQNFWLSGAIGPSFVPHAIGVAATAWYTAGPVALAGQFSGVGIDIFDVIGPAHTSFTGVGLALQFGWLATRRKVH